MTKTPNTHDGGCMCGAVRYRLTGPFSYSAHCHCRSCQRATGAGIATFTGIPDNRFQITKGQLSIYASSPGVQRGFCNTCGTSLTYAGDDWDDMAVYSATLDNPTAAKPTSNVYLVDRQPWIAIDETLKKFDHFP